MPVARSKSARARPAASRVDLAFRAFSDRTRLRLLSLLQKSGEVCVCDLVRVLAVPQPKVSRHLAYLRRAGLVVGRREGAWVHYRLAEPSGEFHKSLMACLACCFAAVPELERDARKLGTPARETDCRRGPAVTCGRPGSDCC